MPKLGARKRDAILATLKERFGLQMSRHEGIAWPEVQARLDAQPTKLWSLSEMERTGGEPDVVGRDDDTGKYVFYGCSKQSPKDRRSVCYDPEALESRKKHKPRSSAVQMANDMGAELLTETQYRRLQKLGEFDTTHVELAEDPRGHTSTRWRHLRRLSLRHCVHISQRRRVILRGPRLSLSTRSLSDRAIWSTSSTRPEWRRVKRPNTAPFC